MTGISTNAPKIIILSTLWSAMTGRWARLTSTPTKGTLENHLAAEQRREQARADVDRLLRRFH